VRPNKDTWFLRLATVASQQATCVRRAVGCVLVDESKKILGVGFNGVPAGLPHCSEGHPCPGADRPSGQGLDECFATHAEANALLQCRDVGKIHAVYSTTAPCIQCVKLLLNTSAQKIIFSEDYAHTAPKLLWESVGREWVHLKDGQRGNWQESASDRAGDKGPPLAAG
jgi:dCMP deaminase